MGLLASRVFLCIFLIINLFYYKQAWYFYFTTTIFFYVKKILKASIDILLH